MSKNDVIKQTTESKISCGAVTWRKITGQEGFEILLIKQFSHVDSWGIPKGKLQPNESCEECAIREVFEETGIKVMLGHGLKSVSNNNKFSSRIVISYLATQVCNSGLTSNGPDSEVADAAWFNVEKLPQVHEYQRPIIQEAVGLIRELIKC